MRVLLTSGLLGRGLSVLVAAGVVWLWLLVSRSGAISPLFLPGPDKAWASLVRGFENGVLLRQTLGTLQHMFYGWLVASVVAVGLGSLIGISPLARRLFSPLLEFLRPLPASAVIPIAIAFMGLSNTMAIFVITFGTLWPILLSTVQGFSSVEPRLYEVAKVLRMGRLETIDLKVVRNLCDRVAVMYLGRVVEEGPADEVFADPRHPYTQALVSSVPRAGVGLSDRILLQGEPPNPAARPKGCAFHPRCAMAESLCSGAVPELARHRGRMTACLRQQAIAPVAA